MALGELERAGLIVRIPGKGTFVNDRRFHLNFSILRSFSEDVELLGEVSNDRILRCEKTLVNDETIKIGQQLGLETGDCLLVTERLKYAGDVPMLYEFMYTSCCGLYDEIHPYVEKEDKVKVSILKKLEDHLGIHIVRGETNIEPYSCEGTCSEYLNLEEGTAILRISQLLYSDLAIPTVYSVALHSNRYNIFVQRYRH